jgi:hypothetical protein
VRLNETPCSQVMEPILPSPHIYTYHILSTVHTLHYTQRKQQQPNIVLVLCALLCCCCAHCCFNLICNCRRCLLQTKKHDDTTQKVRQTQSPDFMSFFNQYIRVSYCKKYPGSIDTKQSTYFLYYFTGVQASSLVVSYQSQLKSSQLHSIPATLYNTCNPA